MHNLIQNPSFSPLKFRIMGKNLVYNEVICRTKWSKGGWKITDIVKVSKLEQERKKSFSQGSDFRFVLHQPSFHISFNLHARSNHPKNKVFVRNLYLVGYSQRSRNGNKTQKFLLRLFWSDVSLCALTFSTFGWCDMRIAIAKTLAILQGS